MNQGPKFLLGTVVDAQKKIHDPVSIFWVSNNNFLKTIARKIAKCGGLGLFLSHIPNKKDKIWQKHLHAQVIDPNKESREEIFSFKKFLGT